MIVDEMTVNDDSPTTTANQPMTTSYDERSDEQ